MRLCYAQWDDVRDGNEDNSSWFELLWKCLWAYDDFSSISYEETKYKSEVFNDYYSKLYSTVTEVSKISVYSKLIDWGWICSPPFVDRYIKITKKLE